MTNEDELKLTMRLYAVEILAVNLFAVSVLQTADPRGFVDRVRRQMIEGARGHAFPGLNDPAMSDLFSAELESAIDRLMEMAGGQIDVVLQGRGKPIPDIP